MRPSGSPEFRGVSLWSVFEVGRLWDWSHELVKGIEWEAHGLEGLARGTF